MSNDKPSVTDITIDEKNLGIISWMLSIVGAVLGLLLRPDSKYVRHWSYLSISFFIIIIASSFLLGIIKLLPLGELISMLIKMSLFVIWIIGVTKSFEVVFWKPILIHDIARKLGIEKM